MMMLICVARRMTRWAEHDPAVIWETVETCIRETLNAAEERHGRIGVVALGITNQRETTLLWDRASGEPLHNAIVWHDARTSSLCQAMREDLGSQVRRDCIRPMRLRGTWLSVHASRARANAAGTQAGQFVPQS